jgi:hypothetical protein
LVSEVDRPRGKHTSTILPEVLGALGVTPKRSPSQASQALKSLQSDVEDAEMSENLQRVQERARELARSGKFIGWRLVAFELRFEPGYREALSWIQSLATQEEIDRLCSEARHPTTRRDPEAA